MNVTALVFNKVHLSLLDSLGSSNSRLSTQNSCNSSTWTVPTQVNRLRFQSNPKDVQRKISVDPGSEAFKITELCKVAPIAAIALQMYDHSLPLDQSCMGDTISSLQKLSPA